MKCCPPASRNFLTRRALRDIPKGLSLQNAWVLSTTCVSLMALYSIPWATFDVEGSFQEVFVIMWLSVSCWFSFLCIFPHLVYGRAWPMALWQRWSIIHHQGGWHEYALWDKFLSATRHKLDGHSFRSIVLTNLGARIFAVTIVPKTIRRCNGCAVGCRETFCCSHEYGDIDQNQHTCQTCKTAVPSSEVYEILDIAEMYKRETLNGYVTCALFASILLELTEILTLIFVHFCTKMK